MSVGDIADFEARLAEDDITFDFARGLLDALEASRAEVAALRSGEAQAVKEAK